MSNDLPPILEHHRAKDAHTDHRSKTPTHNDRASNGSNSSLMKAVMVSPTSPTASFNGGGLYNVAYVGQATSFGYAESGGSHLLYLTIALPQQRPHGSRFAFRLGFDKQVKCPTTTRVSTPLLV